MEGRKEEKVKEIKEKGHSAIGVAWKSEVPLCEDCCSLEDPHEWEQVKEKKKNRWRENTQ